MIKNCNGLLDIFLEDYKGKNLVAVDMTLGNGNDLRKIFSTLGNDSIFYGFDIQEISIKNTKDKFSLDELSKINLILDSHEYIGKYVKENIDIAVYNLGYLPKGDKKIVTNYKKVIKSLDVLLEKLNLNGRVFITFYPGHPSGLEEAIHIEKYLRELNQKEFEIIKFDFINQKNNPPFLIVLEKIKWKKL